MNQEKKLRDGEQLSKLMEIDPKTNRCTDKIEIVSLVHKGGHITLYTKKGNAIHIRLKDLITNLQTDRKKKIVEWGQTLFENHFIIKYPRERYSEFAKIFQKTEISYIKIVEIGNIREAYMEVNDLITNEESQEQQTITTMVNQ